MAELCSIDPTGRAWHEHSSIQVRKQRCYSPEEPGTHHADFDPELTEAPKTAPIPSLAPVERLVKVASQNVIPSSVALSSATGPVPYLVTASFDPYHIQHILFEYHVIRRGLNMLRLTSNALSRCSSRVGKTAIFQAPNQYCLLSTLAILEQRNGKFANGTLSAIAAAKQLGGPVHGFVAGANVQELAGHAAKVDGVDKIVTVESEAYEKVSP